ncbi:hypothetical protein ACPW96_21535 [Micromonospora sp. DT81.3]|uniref:hypothetical protein n=1 Tax=Micromonospora sp. DT81.3 TaxID=3416523 RepID=UPI003CF99A16
MPGDSICPIHGTLRHTAVHEASHAVHALDQGIPFIHLTLHLPHTYAEDIRYRRPFMPGMLTMPPGSAEDWVGPDPVAALVFLGAGTYAEQKLLGDLIPGGLARDLDQFKRGLGLTVLTPAAGKDWNARSRPILDDRWPSLEEPIQTLAAEITDRARDAGANTNDPIVLTRSEISRICGITT